MNSPKNIIKMSLKTFRTEISFHPRVICSDFRCNFVNFSKFTSSVRMEVGMVLSGVESGEEKCTEKVTLMETSGVNRLCRALSRMSSSLGFSVHVAP